MKILIDKEKLKARIAELNKEILYYEDSIYAKECGKVKQELQSILQQGEEYNENEAIEFAKLHVQAALKNAYNNAEVYNKSIFPGDVNYQVEPDSILNAYPLTNIK